MRRVILGMMAGIAATFFAVEVVIAIRGDWKSFECFLIGMCVLLGPPLLQWCLSLTARRLRPKTPAERTADRRRRGPCICCGYDSGVRHADR